MMREIAGKENVPVMKDMMGSNVKLNVRKLF